MFKELKEGKMKKSPQMENNNKEMEFLKRNKIKKLQIKSKKKNNWIKNSLEMFYWWFELAEKQIYELKNRMIKDYKLKNKKKKRMVKAEHSFREMWKTTSTDLQLKCQKHSRTKKKKKE